MKKINKISFILIVFVFLILNAFFSYQLRFNTLINIPDTAMSEENEIFVNNSISFISQPRPSFKLSSNLVSYNNTIIIHNDGELFDLISNNGWPGTGIPEDPFIIANISISNSSGIGIHIENTWSSFIIDNVYVNGSLGSGIFFNSVQNGIINNSVIANITMNSGIQHGISLVNSDFNMIQNTTVTNVFIGLSLETSDENIISNNSFFFSDSGIYLNNTDVGNRNTVIQYNYFSLNTYGAKIDSLFENNNTIINNFAEYNDYGFRIDNPANFINNTALYNSQYGMYFTNVYEMAISDNLVKENYQYGIYVTNSQNCQIFNNEVANNLYGIALLYTTGVNISFNDILNNTQNGIRITGYNSNAQINNNFITNSIYGITGPSSSVLSIINNTIFNNSNAGINFIATSNSYVAFNIITFNILNGMQINFASSNNQITLNHFVNNTQNTYDISNSTNNWISNYYDDYYGGNQYNIPGTSFAVDTTPRALDNDNDGMPNYFEILYGFDINSNDSFLDADNDGFTNLQEFLIGSNPIIAQNFITTTESTTQIQTETQTETQIQNQTLTTTDVYLINITETVIGTSVIYNTTVNSTFTIIYVTSKVEGGTGTIGVSPGFEFIFLIVTLIFFLVYRRRRNKEF